MTDVDDLPLAGLKVVDMTTVIFGPLASQTLGDYGADVVKVEAPGGDTTRYAGPRVSPDMGSFFMGSNRNKRSVVLNIKQEQDRDVLRQLVAQADVFMHNTRPRKLEALGLGPTRLLELNPRLVYAGLHGFREDGPYGGRPAYDDIIQAASGMAELLGRHDGVPRYVPTVVADKTAGLTAVNGILAALMRRERTGKGGFVEIAMFEVMVAWILTEHWYGRQFDPPLAAAGYARVLSVWRRPIPTLNGFVCVVPYTDENWSRTWSSLGQPEWSNDPRFSTLEARIKNIDAVYEELFRHVCRMSTDDALALFRGLDIPCSQVASIDDLEEDEHLKQTGFFRSVEHPSEGRLRLPGQPVRFGSTELPLRPQPRLGEHTEEVLREWGIVRRTEA